MQETDKVQLANYFESLKELSSEQLMEKVDSHLDSDTIEIFVDHIEDFYGVEDDEQLGMLAQLMISGFVAAKEIQELQ